MLRPIVLSILVASGALACSEDTAPTTAAANAVVGKVVAISGKVEAVREGKTRVLAMGAEVFGDDEVVVGADGSVGIDLAHNNARWTLESGRRGKVRESAAWTMAKVDTPTKPVEHATAAAGREGERSAATTSTTAVESAKPPAADEAEPAKPDSREERDSKADRGDLLGDAVEGGGGMGFGMKGTGAGGAGGGGTGTGSIGSYGSIGKGTGTGQGYGVGAGRGGMRGRSACVPSIRIGQPSSQGELDKAIIRRYVKRNVPKLQYCYEKRLLATPTLAGTVSAQFTIGPNGSVLAATAAGVDADVSSCVADVIKRIEFPKPKNEKPVVVTYPFTFRPCTE